MADRSALHAYLSDEAHSTWHRFARENGVSLTGLLEAIGAELDAEIEANGNDPDRVRQPTVKAARRIDADRRRRGGS